LIKISDQSEFITRVFSLIQSSFEEFINTNIKLEIKDYDKIPRDKSVFHIDWTGYHDSIDFVMTIIKDITIFEKKSPKWYQLLLDQDREFLESLDIEISEQSIMTLHILHEFGHVHQLMDFLKKYHIMQYSKFQNISWEAAYLVLGKPRRKNSIYKDNTFFQHMLFDELYANMFKYKYFIKFWKQLQ